MDLKVGGCYGSVAPGFNSVGFLVNGALLLEGGTVTSVFSLEEQQAVTDVIISHIHLDHTKELFFLLDNLAQARARTITLSGVRDIVEGVRTHLFNEQLWPDFSRLPAVSPVLAFREIPEGQFSRLGDVEAMPVRVNHPVPATGYILRHRGVSIAYTGDTGPTADFWLAARGERGLRAVLAETSFPSDMEELALASGHLTPTLLIAELERLGRPDVPVYIFHMKPQYVERIGEEIATLGSGRIQMLEQGRTYEF